ncbi:MAG: hexulose-6-phosphate isomerase [Deltaproteobacteria bacterium]|jgi:hypothetical protein|nr:hexulose-6-phosphate isomerase [Deltaproteobacteria bacterium]
MWHHEQQTPLNLAAIFSDPVSPGISWADIESLLVARGAEKSEGRSFRVRFELNGALAVFHGPHPRPVSDKGAVKFVRNFLESAGVKP